MLKSVSGDFFNTRNTITAECDSEVLHAALGLCQEYNDLLSKTVEGSDVWRLNHAAGQRVSIDCGTARIIRMALQMYEDSNGLFNIAVGPEVALWHFTDGTKRIPDPALLAAAVKRADCAGIRTGDDWAQLPPEVEIDLGGIAKGYIADGLSDFLRAQGVNSANINLGGNVVTIGRKPDGQPWSVGLQTPSRDYTIRDHCWATVSCEDESLVVSGSYERGFELNGKWYHHILNPKTGFPAQTEVLSVAAKANTSLLADAITTPLFLMGAEKGMELAKRYDVEAAFYLTQNRVVVSKGMNIRLLR